MQFSKGALASAIALSCAACAKTEGDGPAAPNFSFRDLGVEAPVAQPITPLTRIVVPTYEGSGQAVHPDVLWFPRGWHGFEYWMAFTPFPGGQQRFENPSVVVSHDGVSWRVPEGLSNPLVRTPKSGFNSDPDLSYDPVGDRLLLLTREVRRGFNTVSLLSSDDGSHWKGPRKAFVRRNHGMISPTLVLQPGRDPRVWFVDGGTRPCPSRVTRVMSQEGSGQAALTPREPERGWGPAKVVGLTQPGHFIWHIDVAWVPARNEYWAVYPAYASNGCGARDLFFARSPDGTKWTTYAVPLLKHQDAQWTRAMLYRAATLYDPDRDVIRLYLSAAAPGPDWRLGMVEFKFSDLLARLETASVQALTSLRLPKPGPMVDDAALP